MNQGRRISMAHSPQFLKLVNEAKKQVKRRTSPNVKRRMDSGEKFLLVDVRRGQRVEKGHIPGAVHMARGVD